MDPSPSTATASCPVCREEITRQGLQTHLAAHSKLDLIQLVVQQQKGLSPRPRQLDIDSSNVSSSHQLKSPGSEAEDPLSIAYSTDYDASQSHDGSSRESLSNSAHSMAYNFNGPHHSRSTASSFASPILKHRVLSSNTDGSLSSSVQYGLASAPIPLSTQEYILPSGSEHDRDSLRQVVQDVVIESGPEYSIQSAEHVSRVSHAHHSPSEAVQEESDNATSQTSIIKYIRDHGGKPEEHVERLERSLVLPDGRTIPVYASFSRAEATKITLNEVSLAERVTIGGPITLNLMTDEELPPRGEISEFEESNTSSLVSEDSKLGLIVEPGLKTDSKAGKRRKCSSIVDGKGHQFSCNECSVKPKFKSLFELIGHKVKVHPPIVQEFSSQDQATSSIPIIFKHPFEEQTEPEPVTGAKTSKEFFCVYCNVTFNDKVTLAMHMKTDHSDKPVQPTVFECNTCGKTFQARTNLRKHLLVHKERKHVCTVCSKGFTTNFKLLEHARVHTKMYPYKCNECNKLYRTPSLLNHHMKTVHVPDSEKPTKTRTEFCCGICRKVLKSKRSWNCHAKTHLTTPKKCPFCSEIFSRPSVLVRHVRVSHDPQYESSESKNCSICQKKLHPNSIIKHMRIHANEKPYSCPVCSKTFRTYANLSSHSWSHTTLDKPFKCKVCPKSYLFKRTLEHHMMAHKRRTLHFVCNECGVRFTNKVNMKRHVEEHYSEKKYKCKTCNKTFQRNYYLLEHERIHSGLKPFVCNICGKASTTKSNHRAHLKIHDARDAGSQEG